jgi:acyl-CoA thioesterase-1
MFFGSVRVIVFLLLLSLTTISHAQEKTTRTILLFGDSIVAGYGLNQNDFLSTQLENALKEKGLDVKIINAGVSGDTTSGGRSRLQWTLDKYKPDILFIALGGNDFLRGVPPNITRENVDAMLVIAGQNKTATILSAVEVPANMGVEYMQSFNSIYPDLSKKYKIYLYPFLLKNIFGSNIFMQSDGIHPTAIGIKKVADELADFFSDNLMQK